MPCQQYCWQFTYLHNRGTSVLHNHTVPLHPVIPTGSINWHWTQSIMQYMFSSVCRWADNEGMLHVCIPVAICVGLCRCAVVKAWAWRHWTFWSVASAGVDRKRREKRKTVLQPTRNGYIFSQIRGWYYASCVQQRLKVNAELLCGHWWYVLAHACVCIRRV